MMTQSLPSALSTTSISDAEPDPLSLFERYSAMVTMRSFEMACAQGIVGGDIRGELHLAVGQEGVAAGILGAVRREDWLVGTHRSHPWALAKGVDPYRTMAEIFEKSTGLCGGKGGHLHLFSKEHRFSTTGIVGSSLPVALGHAYAAMLESKPYVGVGITGDGGTNSGQFHETLNMAAIWKLPLVVIVENNGYGISVRSTEAIAEPGIIARAKAYGLWAAGADGTDVEDVADVMRNAFAHARSGHGPVLVEVSCGRYSGHYEGDPDHYRSKAEKEQMRKRDPLVVARNQLISRDGFLGSDLDAHDHEVEERMLRLLSRVRTDVPPDISTARKGVFVEVQRA